MKMLDEGFLPGLYAKKVAEFAADNVDGIQYQLEKFGRGVAVGALKAVPDRPHPNAAIGDNAHAAIEALTLGNELPHFDTITARRMFESYQGFLSEHKPKVLRSEYTVWSYKHGYAGTGDLLWELPDLGTGIVDVKTGMRIWPKVGMQTAALSNADSLIAVNGEETEMPEIHWQGVLHVRPRSAKLYKLEHTDANFQAFLACLTLFNWTRFQKDHVIPAYPGMQYPPLPPRHEGPLPERRWPD